MQDGCKLSWRAAEYDGCSPTVFGAPVDIMVMQLVPGDSFFPFLRSKHWMWLVVLLETHTSP